MHPFRTLKIEEHEIKIIKISMHFIERIEQMHFIRCLSRLSRSPYGQR